MNEILREKLNLEAESLNALKNEPTKKELRIVAEGDSWFDYPLVLDVIDHLRKMGYYISKKSKAMDTLENMVFGSEYKYVKKLKGVINEGPVNLQETLNAVRQFQPRFVLFSGGGNDIVGQELVQYLFHKSLNSDVLREDVLESNLDNFIKPSIEFFCKAVWNSDEDIDILMDGYDYAKPNGKKYLGVVGPWLLPAFGSKAITLRKEQDEIIKKLVDRFNELLKKLDDSYPRFHHIDLRGMFPKENQWHNEIHLKGKEFKKVAMVYKDKMESILSR